MAAGDDTLAQVEALGAYRPGPRPASKPMGTTSAEMAGGHWLGQLCNRCVQADAKARKHYLHYTVSVRP